MKQDPIFCTFDVSIIFDIYIYMYIANQVKQIIIGISKYSFKDVILYRTLSWQVLNWNTNENESLKDE